MKKRIIFFIKKYWFYIALSFLSAILFTRYRFFGISNTINLTININKINDLNDIEEECFDIVNYRKTVPKYIAIHCTANPPKMFTAHWLLNYFYNERGWSRPGYHYVVNPDGSVINLIQLDNDRYLSYNEIANSVAGKNHEVIAIAYSGGTDNDLNPKDTRTISQKVTIDSLVRVLSKKYPNVLVQGHRDFPNVDKACPSYNVKKEYLSKITI